MIVTPLKLVRVSTTRSYPLIRPMRVANHKVEEFAAWIRGEGACEKDVTDVLSAMPEHVKPLLQLPEALPPRERVRLVMNNGSKKYSKASLRRQFQLIDDYFSDFPEQDSITLPFTREQVTGTLSRHLPLVECCECLSYLNPKDALTYFDFDTTGSPPCLILSITERLTEENRKDILEARRASPMAYPLPNEGLGLGILGHIFQSHSDTQSLLHFFSCYPSYLLFAVVDYNERVRLLVTNHYNSGEYLPSNEYLLESLSSLICIFVISSFFHSATREDQKKHLGRVLAMMGKVHPLFENEGLDNILPYGIDPVTLQSHFDEDDIDYVEIASTFEVDEQVVRDAIAGIACRKERRPEMVPLNLDDIDLDVLPVSDAN